MTYDYCNRHFLARKNVFNFMKNLVDNERNIQTNKRILIKLSLDSFAYHINRLNC